MRGHALRMGLSMNEHGFTNKDSQQKVVCDDDIVSEKDIFDKLNLVYVSPENRVDMRSLVQNIPKEASQTQF